MKAKINKTLAIIGLVMFSTGAFAQPPQPPSGGHGSGTNEPGGGAPIGSGIGILLTLGAAYGGKKIYKVWKTREDAES